MNKGYFMYKKGRLFTLRQASKNSSGHYELKDVIDWFLSKGSMSPKKLQKLLYYAYSWTLTLQNEDPDELNNKLFSERFKAWVHGPVIPQVYHDFKKYGYNDIEQCEKSVVFETEVEDVLEQVWSEYGGYTGNQLESITHQENPWIKARGDASPIERCNTPINDQDIYEYYIQQVEYD